MKKKVGLVLEGGAMRGLFTAGVLDTFLENDIKVDGIVGVSAGALFGPNYFSRQKGRALRYNKRFCKNPRYISLLSFLLTGNVINKKFAFYKITKELDIFDNDEFIKNNTGYYATVTNIETGKPEYFEIKNVIEDLEILRASSAIPMVSKIVSLNGKKYLDGGVSDSVPFKKCKELGFDKIIVVLTQDLNYRKKPMSSKSLFMFSKKYNKYPKLIEIMKNRHNAYNNTIKEIVDLENKGEIFVIRPSSPITIKRLENDKNKLQEVYDLGVKDAKNSLKKLKDYLK